MRQRHKATLIAINLLYVSMLVFCIFRVRIIQPQPMEAIRNKLESSATFDDLRRRAHYAINALESGEKVVASLREMIMGICGAGIGTVVLNGALMYLFLRARPEENDGKA
jgi:hypothetical protein